MTPAKREKLQAAVNRVMQMQQAKETPEAILAALQGEHGAIYDRRSPGFYLRCAGLVATSTSMPGTLLSNWRTNATLKLAAENHQ